jgi:putative ABC transport system substrate-binding protein
MIATVNAASTEWYRTLNDIAPTLALEPLAVPFKDRSEIEGIIRSVASRSDSGLIVAGDSFTVDPAIRRQIIALTSTHRLPTLYGITPYAVEGGLMAYGIDRIDPYRRAAGYVDRILKGDKPSDLPVQQPTKFTFVINLKTAKTLGLDLSPTFVGTADEVIE